MKKEDIVLNTLVFMEDHKKGVKQVDMLERCKDLGVSTVEVRREYFTDIDNETLEVGRKAKELNLNILYSVPKYMYIDGKLQVEDMETYFKEAKALGSPQVKVVIGDYNTDNIKEDAEKINELCNKFNSKVLIENDQSPENGRADKMVSFVKSFREADGRVSAVFDIGNFVWQKEDPIKDAEKLCKYVEYIHLKDVDSFTNPKTVYLSEGVIDWKRVLEILPKGLKVALEYPCGENAYEVLKSEIEKLIY